ncbi:MAG: hypothetical protein PF501_20135 [Salinisphaera sp.]|jgi:hypothetical protein|nr:hypothetical protein [Salinisphaera sp.]
MSDSSESKRMARALLEAHVAFELAQWQGKSGAKRMRQLVDTVWQWAGETQLSSVVSVDTVRGAAERLALDMALPDVLAGVIGAIADELIRLETNRDTQIQDVVDQALFDDGVALFIELEELRARLIKRLLDSPVYTALAGDVLYQGIKDYIFADSGAINSIPGVSKLLKGSSSAVSKRLPGLEAQVERRVKAYIENNTAKTLARSEQYLLDSLDAERIRSIADEIWEAVHDKPLSIEDVVDSNEIQKLVDYGLRIWQELRQTEYVGVMVDEAVQRYFTHHGEQTLAELMAHVGIDRDLLLAEAQTLGPEIVAGLSETGLLEQLVRDQLEPFYQFDAFKDAMKSADTKA